MVPLTEKGCHGINAPAESRGEKLFAMVSQAARKNCWEECTNKKDNALHLKRKSANLTPNTTKKKSLRSNETFLSHGTVFVLRKMNPKRRKLLKN